ncbi:AMP-dependent synthetase [Variovorax paradoxus]|jgi:long-chain acyl-CoA synthetase|uniref:class I adenylate-forming enzyme family protein n=1 Tax=Variovorax paradoxus TaxID=34073 RepID=UPI0006E4AD00|nr:AMP-dependent synthetase [Variovorax paradoxus]KPV10581.1 AMP-dependent synthetase [Variovorax paradoxus]KPV12974.1 AMP-dependent synthetase [Variovorax paradoxus]KPV25065.1 AMP-dependent synthetase [Variovorax paradoxus]KPV36202.1 AMP-dependent synthetase [Variovorax paradoxus]
MRLEHFMAAHALRTPTKPAVVIGGKALSYGELQSSARSLATGLRRAGVMQGDRIVVYLPNCVEFVQLLYAAFTIGAVVIPVNNRNTPRELVYFVQDSQARLLVFHSTMASAMREVDADFGAIRRFSVGGEVPGAESFDALLSPSDERVSEIALAPDDAMILYTSGTTGKPKGAILTHANFVIGNAFINAVEWGVTADEVFLVTTPLAHRTGLARLMNSMCLGAKLVVMERFDAQAAVDMIEREQVTAAGMVPTVARMLMPVLEQQAARCASLRHIIVTGEAFPVELKRRMIGFLPQARLHSFFAMTEVGSVTVLNHDEQFTHPSSVGRVTPGVQVKLVDDAGRQVSVDDVGEILVRSGEAGRFTTMKGYFGRPDATASTIVDGWVHTGDMGRFDADGYLYIVDRKKDMVLSGGFNIYTKEVEQVLVEHEGVADAAVVGVPDEIFGEAVAAFVELHPGARLDADDLVEHARSRIASYKKPRHVFFVDALPRNGVGKVLKADLREMALARLAGSEQLA